MRNSLRCHFARALAAACAAAVASDALANRGRYLPDANQVELQGVQGFRYPRALFALASEYDQQLDLGLPCSVGRFHFTQDIWQGNAGASGTKGGAALAGGFELGADTRVDAMCRLCWVQVVTSTFAGQNEWGAVNGQTFPDTNSGRTDPCYPHQSLPGAPSPFAPLVNPAFQDVPCRYFNDGPQYWEAELALCALNDLEHELCIIASFKWGFNIVRVGDDFELSFDPPNSFAAGGSSTLFHVLTDAFDGNGLTGGTPPESTPWMVSQGICGCFACVPTPGSAAMALLSIFAAARRRRAAHVVVVNSG